jgi:hypothetical protein
LISLGTNDAANTAASSGGVGDYSKIVTQVQQLAARFAPKDWIWIGPPWMGDKIQWARNVYMSRLYDAADEAGVPIFDSRDVTRPYVEQGSGDGVHLGPVGAKAWGDAVADKLEARAAVRAAMPYVATGAALAAGFGLYWLWRRGFL